MQELKIDPELQSIIPPLSDEEFKLLRDSILEIGEVLEPICIWQGIIVDGHNRWKIIQENPDILYRVHEMIFTDRLEVIEWMYRNQLGRRNLSDEMRSYIKGKLYKSRKKFRVEQVQTSIPQSRVDTMSTLLSPKRQRVTKRLGA